MDFRELMSQIHEEEPDSFAIFGAEMGLASVENLVRQSEPRATADEPTEEACDAGEETFDIEAVRDYLIDFYGAQMFGGMSGSAYGLVELDNLSDEEVIAEAEKCGVDLDDYRR